MERKSKQTIFNEEYEFNFDKDATFENIPIPKMTNKQVINPSNQFFVNLLILIFAISPMKVGATPKVLERISSRIIGGTFMTT